MDPGQLYAWVAASSELTHSDPQATDCAYLIAIGARMASEHGADGPARFLDMFRRPGGSEHALATSEATRIIDVLHRAVAEGHDPAEVVVAAYELHRGVTGYAEHSTAAALACWFKHSVDLRLPSTRRLRSAATRTPSPRSPEVSSAPASASSKPTAWRDT